MNQQIINCLSVLLKLFPLKNKILFESHPDFSDNSYAVFEELLQNEKLDEFEIVWLSKKKKKHLKQLKITKNNVKIIVRDSKNPFIRFLEYYHIATTKYAFYSHGVPPFKLDRGEIFVNLWHGSGIKNINFLKFDTNFDYVLCNSDFYVSAYSKFYDIPTHKLVKLGNPRTDYFFKKVDTKDLLNLSSFKNLVVWLPTYRKHKLDDRQHFTFDSNIKSSLPILTEKQDFLKLNQILKRHNSVLVIKPHPAQDISNFPFIEMSNIKVFNSEYLSSKSIQLYSLLGDSSALITDYSSVFVDYLLMDKPILFTIDDMDSYVSGFMLDDPLSIMPGAKVKNSRDFCSELETILTGKDLFQEKRKEIKSFLHYNISENISNDILKLFLNKNERRKK